MSLLTAPFWTTASPSRTCLQFFAQRSANYLRSSFELAASGGGNVLGVSRVHLGEVSWDDVQAENGGCARRGGHHQRDRPVELARQMFVYVRLALRLRARIFLGSKISSVFTKPNIAKTVM